MKMYLTNAIHYILRFKSDKTEASMSLGLLIHEHDCFFHLNEGEHVHFILFFIYVRMYAHVNPPTNLNHMQIYKRANNETKCYTVCDITNDLLSQTGRNMLSLPPPRSLGSPHPRIPSWFCLTWRTNQNKIDFVQVS